jgi:hypothetical protein
MKKFDMKESDYGTMLAFGDYFSFLRSAGDESQLFLRIAQSQVRQVNDDVVIRIPMDLWLVMHTLGVPSLDMANMSDEDLREQAEREVAFRIHWNNAADQDLITVGTRAIGEFGSSMLEPEDQVAWRLAYLMARREIQCAILERSRAHVNLTPLAGFLGL